MLFFSFGLGSERAWECKELGFGYLARGSEFVCVQDSTRATRLAGRSWVKVEKGKRAANI